MTPTRLVPIPHDGAPAAVDPASILAVRAWRRAGGTEAIVSTERDSLRLRWDDVSDGLAARAARPAAPETRQDPMSYLTWALAYVDWREIASSWVDDEIGS